MAPFLTNTPIQPDLTDPTVWKNKIAALCGPNTQEVLQLVRDRDAQLKAKQVAVPTPIPASVKGGNEPKPSLSPLPAPFNSQCHVRNVFTKLAKAVAEGEIKKLNFRLSEECVTLRHSLVQAACMHPSLCLFRFIVEMVGWQTTPRALRIVVGNDNLMLGKTPGQSKQDSLDIIGFLLDNPRADLNLASPIMSRYLLNSAAKTHSTDLFDLLLQKGAKLEHSWPIQAAIDSPYGEVKDIGATVEHLLGLGVDINGGYLPGQNMTVASREPVPLIQAMLDEETKAGGSWAYQTDPSPRVRDIVLMLLTLGACPLPGGLELPALYHQGVEHIQGEKGNITFWQEVWRTAWRALPHWPSAEGESMAWVGKQVTWHR